jgi:hypothetical protein
LAILKVVMDAFSQSVLTGFLIPFVESSWNRSTKPRDCCVPAKEWYINQIKHRAVKEKEEEGVKKKKKNLRAEAVKLFKTLASFISSPAQQFHPAGVCGSGCCGGGGRSSSSSNSSSSRSSKRPRPQQILLHIIAWREAAAAVEAATAAAAAAREKTRG